PCSSSEATAAGAVRDRPAARRSIFVDSRALTARGAGHYDARVQIWLDVAPVPREAAKVSVFDHGLLYGDGVFEGIRIYNRRIFRLDAHLDRLYDSARALALTIPLSPRELADAVRTTVR